MSQRPFDPVSASKKIGVITQPIGTLDEIKKAGYDPQFTACCHKHGNGILGCGSEERCPFTEENVGGYNGPGSTNFKGSGPKMLGVQIVTARNEGDSEFQRQTTCYNFVKTCLSRMQHGIAQAALRKDHEIVQIVSVEGDGFEMWQTKYEPVDAAAYANGTNRRETMVDEAFTVQPFPRPGEMGMGRERSVSQRIRQQRLDREKEKRSFYDEAAKKAREGSKERREAQREKEEAAADAASSFELEDLEPAGEAEEALLEGAVATEAKSEPQMRPSRIKP